MRTSLFPGVLVSVALVAGGVRQAPQVANNPFAGDAAGAAAGGDLYNQMCQACHGAAGQGTDRGPALTTGTFVHGGTDGELFRSIRNGVAGTQMAGFPGLADPDIWRLVTYLRSLQPGSAAPTATGDATSGDAAAGERLFFGSAACSSCHEVHGRGGIVGPDLSSAGRFSSTALRQKLLEPNSPMVSTGGRGNRSGPQPATIVVKTKDGRDLRGV